MLAPAQLYEDELWEEKIKAWYKPENIYLNGGPGNEVIDLPEDNRDGHHFVSVDGDGNAIGEGSSGSTEGTNAGSKGRWQGCRTGNCMIA